MVNFAEIRARNKEARDKAIIAAQASVDEAGRAVPQTIPPQAKARAVAEPKPLAEGRDLEDDLGAAQHMQRHCASALNDWETTFLKSLVFRMGTQQRGLTEKQGASLDKMRAKHVEDEEDEPHRDTAYANKNDKPLHGSTRQPARAATGFDDMDDDIPF